MKTVAIGKLDANWQELLEECCRDAGLEVVGKAEDWQEVVELAKEKKPDIVILGDHLPEEADGRRAANEIGEALPGAFIIAFSNTNWGFGHIGFDERRVDLPIFVAYLKSLAEPK